MAINLNDREVYERYFNSLKEPKTKMFKRIGRVVLFYFLIAVIMFSIAMMVSLVPMPM